MKCPHCKTSDLVAAELVTSPSQGLSAKRCETCKGHWVDGETYLMWVQRQGTNLPEKQPDSVTELPVSEGGKAKLCPGCGRFLVRAKVGHGTSFQLERCGGCGGIWFDANEWESLVARNLHDDVHFIFSSTWQADVLRKHREQQYEQRMITKLGEADWKEIQRIKAWLDGHAKRSELYAVLADTTDSGK